MLHVYVPHSQQETDGDLGKAYNDFMEYVKEDDWVCFLDSDAVFTHREWYRDIENIIKENPDYGLYTTMTNRVGCPYQKFEHVDVNEHNMRYHREVGKSAAEQFKGQLLDITMHRYQLSGVTIIISKKAWKSVGGFIRGFLRVDNEIHRQCARAGIKVGLIPGIYVYHWYRADNDFHVHDIERKLHA